MKLVLSQMKTRVFAFRALLAGMQGGGCQNDKEVQKFLQLGELQLATFISIAEGHPNPTILYQFDAFQGKSCFQAFDF